MKRVLALVAVVTMLATACGDDGDSEADDETTTTTSAPAEEPEPEEPEPEPEPEPEEAEPEPEPEEAEPEPEPEPEEPSATTVAVTLTEWSVGTDAELSAGAHVFEISNVGQFPHQFGVVRGTSYDDLPKLDNGAIDEAAVAGDIVGISDSFESGSTGTVELDLEPGSYMFFCNVNLGPNSHAANGQTLSVTVT